MPVSLWISPSLFQWKRCLYIYHDKTNDKEICPAHIRNPQQSQSHSKSIPEPNPIPSHSPPHLLCLENPDAPTLSSPLPLPFPFPISLFAHPFPSYSSPAANRCFPDPFPSAADDAVGVESMYSKIATLCILCSGLILGAG